jgi:hypothetical protein
MRYAVLVLGILGGVIDGALGAKWISDYKQYRATVESLESMGADLSQLESLVQAGYALVLAFVLGLAGGVLALRRQGRLAGGLMLAGPVLAAMFAPQSLVFSSLLIVGGLLAFTIKSGPRAAAAG